MSIGRLCNCGEEYDSRRLYCPVCGPDVTIERLYDRIEELKAERDALKAEQENEKKRIPPELMAHLKRTAEFDAEEWGDWDKWEESSIPHITVLIRDLYSALTPAEQEVAEDE